MLFSKFYLFTSFNLDGEDSLPETLEIFTCIGKPQFEEMIAHDAEVFTVNLYWIANILFDSDLENVLVYSRSILIQELVI